MPAGWRPSSAADAAPSRRERDDHVANRKRFSSVEGQTALALCEQYERHLLQEWNRAAALLPRRFLRAPEVKQPMRNRARLHLRGLLRGQEVARGALADVADDFDVDADRRDVDRRGGPRPGVRDRDERPLHGDVAEGAA